MDLYINIKRNGYDEKKDILLAKERGAIVLAQEGGDYQYHDLQEAYGIFLQEMNDNPAHSICVIGVTGTNGKTTVTSYLYQMLTKLQKKAILIGTNGIYYQNTWESSVNTTPSQEVLAKWFSFAKTEKVDVIIMEVSSIGLDQKRIAGIAFDYMIFTNVTQDHLDYHGSIQNYQLAKYKAFSYLKEKGIAIVDTDDEVLRLWKSQVHVECLEYNEHQVDILQLQLDGSLFVFNEFLIATNQLAKCNVYNLCACILVLKAMQFSHKQITNVCKKLDTIDGRFQLLHKKPYVFVDFAHTPDALLNILSFTKNQTDGKSIVVFGCGGNRDRLKRSIMGNVACSFADVVVLTEDNSRDESLDQILSDIRKGCHEKALVIENREDAIKYTLSIANNNDIIIIAGKGNERVLDKNGMKQVFSDADIVLDFYKGRIA